MAAISRRLRIHGRVQGVFFRAWAVQEARALGLSGWVRNRADGSVELLAHGADAEVAKLVERCRRGPPAAKVERIEAEEVDDPGTDGFETRATC